MSVILKKEATACYEDDLSAESQAEKERTRLQKENEHEKRKKCFEEETGEGTKEDFGIRDRRGWSFCFILATQRAARRREYAVKDKSHPPVLCRIPQSAGEEYAET
jgi:hypothetical protein